MTKEPKDEFELVHAIASEMRESMATESDRAFFHAARRSLDLCEEFLRTRIENNINAGVLEMMKGQGLSTEMLLILEFALDAVRNGARGLTIHDHEFTHLFSGGDPARDACTYQETAKDLPCGLAEAQHNDDGKGERSE